MCSRWNQLLYSGKKDNSNVHNAPHSLLSKLVHLNIKYVLSFMFTKKHNGAIYLLFTV